VFSAPLWLYALATLAIPLALHLWSRRPREVIRVGSLRHVTDLAEARSWSARLTEPLLLLLRLAILASIVLALAGPRISNARLGRTVGQLVLVEPELLADPAPIRSDPLLDSLARSRATVHLLQWGFPKVQLDGVKSEFQVPHASPAASGTIWDLLLAADHLVSPGGGMIVIARPRVSALGGRRPALRARVDWHVPPSPPALTWSAARWRTAGDTLVTLTGRGDTRGIRYQSEAAPASRNEHGCDGCTELRPLSVLVAATDAGSSVRLRLAAAAVGALLGQPVRPAASVDSADLVLTTSVLSDSLLRLDRAVASISPAVVASPALADTVLAHWPWQPLARDPADPREVSLAQALPAAGAVHAPDRRDARIPLLLLALVLFTVERWIATRPARRVA
jgi:Aerotolerance regulator N-terminal